MPRRNTSTQTTKIAPWITSTHWPKGARIVLHANHGKGADHGPKTVPRPPNNVISSTSPDMVQCTSVSEAS